MHKLCRILFAKGPEIARGLVAGIIKGKSARLQMCGAEIITLAQKIYLECAFADLHTLRGERGRAVAPEIEAVVSLALVKGSAVKLIVPNELPLFICGKKALCVILYRIRCNHIASGQIHLIECHFIS
jgi:hypothetical protein